MNPPRPGKKLAKWTEADHAENERLIQKDADRKLLDRVGRCLRLKRGELAGALSRLIGETVQIYLSRQFQPLDQQLRDVAAGDALRSAIFDLVADDVLETFQILKAQGSFDDSRDAPETPASRCKDTSTAQRDVHQTGEEQSK